MSKEGYSRPAIAGSGTIACGLAAISSSTADTVLLARSDASAWRAEEQAVAACAKVEGADAAKLRVTTDAGDLARCDLVVEAVIEDIEHQGGADRDPGRHRRRSGPRDHDILALGHRPGAAQRASRSRLRLPCLQPRGAHEAGRAVLPDQVDDDLRERALAWCAALGKTAVEVPDQAGFVVNRLLFPYLFDAVRLLERTGMNPGEVDSCMTLGAGHPMGPLALLDFIGLDVAQAIGDTLHSDSDEDAHRPPGLLVEMVGQGKLGRKSGAGFYEYG